MIKREYFDVGLQLLKLYLCSFQTKKKLLQFIYRPVCFKMAKVMPAVKKIAKFIGKTNRQALRIIQEYEGIQCFILGRIPRKTKSGKRSSSEFILDPEFILVYRWLAKEGYLNSPKSKFEKIIKHYEKHQKIQKKATEKCHNKTIKNVTTKPPISIDKKNPYKELFYKDIKETNKEKSLPVASLSFGFISNPLRRLEMAHDDIVLISKKFSERAIVETVEAVEYQLGRGKIIKNISAYVIGTAKNKEREYREKFNGIRN